MQEQPLTREQFAAETQEQTAARMLVQFQSTKKKYVKTALFDEKKFRETLPPEMLKAKRWMRYFLKPKDSGGTAKIPLGNHADATTWSFFDEAVAALEPGIEQGLGYAFYEGEIQGLDIDHCRNTKTGKICNEAMMLLSRLPSWAEYSVSGQGIHVLFKGNVRGKQLNETTIQYWNPKNSPRFFALTCDLVGEAFSTLKDIGDDFNYVFATARHISAKIREELREVDYEQWAALPAEREVVEPVTKEKGKTKSRKVAAGFDIKDFLAFYGLKIDNETDNELGHCIRLTTCPLKGEAHAGHNNTTCNFIYPCRDGGLAYHCQSTGCVEYGIKEALAELAKQKGPYSKPIYEAKQPTVKQTITIQRADTVTRESTLWLIPEFLPLCEVTAFSGEMDTRKSTTAIDIAAKGSTGGGQNKCWFNNTAFEVRPFSTVYGGTEDSFPSTVLNRFLAAGGNPKAFGNIPLDVVNKKESPDGVEEWSTPLSFDEHLNVLHDAIIEFNKTALYPVGLLINDPLIAFFGDKNFNKAQDCQAILRGLKKLCEELNISIINLMHYNKTQGASAKEKTGGSQRLIEAHRQAWGFTLIDETDKESNTLIAPIKKNLLRVAQSYEVTTVSTPVEWEEEGVKKRDEVGVVQFVRLSDQTADGQLQEKESKDKSKQTEMRDSILEVLKAGAVAPGVVYKTLRDLGSESTILRAVNKLIKAGKLRKEGTGPSNTLWMLAATPEQEIFDVAFHSRPAGTAEARV